MSTFQTRSDPDPDLETRPGPKPPSTRTYTKCECSRRHVFDFELAAPLIIGYHRQSHSITAKEIERRLKEDGLLDEDVELSKMKISRMRKKLGLRVKRQWESIVI